MSVYKSKFTGIEIDNAVAHSLTNGNPHGTTLAQLGGSNPNLLDDWDFRNSTNQRSVSSVSASYQYLVDRWCIYGYTSGTATLSSYGVTISGSYDFGTAIESSRLPNTPNLNVTMSAVTSTGVLITRSATLLNNGSQEFVIHDSTSPAFKIVFARNWNSGRDLFYFVSMNASVTLSAAKLEIGSTSTLLNDFPTEDGEQLAKCQRYYQPIPTLYAPGHCASSTIAFVAISVPVSMRITPTVIVSGVGVLCAGGSSFTPTAISVAAMNGNQVHLAVTCSGGLPAGVVCLLRDAIIALSADL